MRPDWTAPRVRGPGRRLQERPLPLEESRRAAHRRGMDAAQEPLRRLEGTVRSPHPDDPGQQLGHRGAAQQQGAARGVARRAGGAPVPRGRPRRDLRPDGRRRGRTNHSKWNVDHFTQEAFIDKVVNGTLDLAHDGFDPDIDRVPLEHARWFAALASQLTAAQLRRAFEAAGAAPGRSRRLLGEAGREDRRAAARRRLGAAGPGLTTAANCPTVI